MKTFTKTLFAGIAASAMIAGAATTAAVAMDYKGKTVKIVIPYGPGGTYDKYGVAFSNHLGNHIPGNPNIILQHMPGAGGAKAMNWFANVAPKDGLIDRAARQRRHQSADAPGKNALRRAQVYVARFQQPDQRCYGRAYRPASPSWKI